MNRRTFLGTLTAATVLARNFAWAADGHRAQPLGVQLYTLRHEMQADAEGTIAQLAAIGYKNLELAGFAMDGGKISYYKQSPQDLRAMCDRHGITVISAHVNYKSLTPENFPAVLEASRTLGQTYIVNPSVDEATRNQPDGWKRIAESFNQAGEMSRKAGFQFAYHNHRFEFARANGEVPYEILLRESDPHLVKMEMDICWVIVGGGDPLKYIKQYPGRFPLVHLKDMKKIPPPPQPGAPDADPVAEMTEVGSGIIGWKNILSHAKNAGIQYYIVEHDGAKMPFDSVKTSYEYLQKLRF